MPHQLAKPLASAMPIQTISMITMLTRGININTSHHPGRLATLHMSSRLRIGTHAIQLLSVSVLLAIVINEYE